MQIKFQQATQHDAELIRQMASAVWYVTYSATHSPEQLDYMFEMMYSVEKIKSDCTGNNSYHILYEDDKPVGYLSLTEKDSTLILQKVYLLPAAQGKGYGRRLIHEAEKYARSKDINKLKLIVNRFNRALHFYKHSGFEITGERDFDIGNGYCMNDYIMEKTLL